jgi:hypothetical protein
MAGIKNSNTIGVSVIEYVCVRKHPNKQTYGSQKNGHYDVGRQGAKKSVDFFVENREHILRRFRARCLL